MKKQVGDELIEMTADEIKLVTDYQTDVANKEKELADKAADKAALLIKLGITADEAALLLG